MSGFGFWFGPGRRRDWTNQSPFDPAGLFGAGDLGAWYDPDNLALMWQDTAATIAAVVNGPVARLDASGGTFAPLLQGSAALQPILRINGATGKHYLQFDQADDVLVTAANQSFNTNDTATVASAVVAAGPAKDVALIQFGGSTSSGSIGIRTVNSTTQFAPLAFSAGNNGSGGALTASAAAADQLPAPRPLVLTARGQISADLCELRINGAVAASSAQDQGTLNYGSRQVKVGREFGTSINGEWHGALIVNRLMDPGEIAQIEALFAARTGAVL